MSEGKGNTMDKCYEESLRQIELYKESLKGKVRIVRTVVYEGNAEDILKTLARSLPCGERDAVGYKITVIQHPAVKIEESQT